MEFSKGQGQLFPDRILFNCDDPEPQLNLNRKLIEAWQQRLQSHQSRFFKKNFNDVSRQVSLLGNSEPENHEKLKPLQLAPLPLSFWRWPNSPHQGPAIYLVMDRPPQLDMPLLLYIGETIAADRRWKGEHDCKDYLASYSEAMSDADLQTNLSIRFWTDVPSSTKARRKLEQQLIQRWLPPFNKETRARWATPFTANSY